MSVSETCSNASLKRLDSVFCSYQQDCKRLFLMLQHIEEMLLIYYFDVKFLRLFKF